MTNGTNTVSLRPGDRLPMEIVVALLIGDADYPHAYPDVALLTFLERKKESATVELVNCQFEINSASTAESARAAKDRLQEIQARLGCLESGISDARRYLDDIAAECAKGGDCELRYNEEVAEIAGELIFTLPSVEWWVRKKYRRSLMSPGVADHGAIPDASVPNLPDSPWLAVNPKDPKPEQPWYAPARYFARQLVKDDTTLLTKRDVLCDKVAASLKGAGIYKRGGKHPFSTGTVKKALVNVKLG